MGIDDVAVLFGRKSRARGLEFKRARVCRTWQPRRLFWRVRYVRVLPAKKVENIILRLGVG